MSVAQNDSVHHRVYEPSPTVPPSRNPQEYGNNNTISSILNKDGAHRRSTPRAATPNSNGRHVVEAMSDNTASHSNHSPNSTTISTASPSNLSVNNPLKMRAAPPDVDATRVPSPAAAASSSPNPTRSKAPVPKDVSPVPTTSDSSTTAATLDETPQPPSKTRPTLTAPASPPPSPPSASAIGAAAIVDSPVGFLSTAPQSTMPTPVRGGSLASLLHSAHREVDVPDSSTTERREPLSPRSMTHSRTATMTSASTGVGPDSPMKTTQEGGNATGVSGGGGGEPMDIDPPRSGEGAGSTVSTPTGLGGKTPIPYHPSRSPLARPHSATAMTSSGLHRSQPSPSPPTTTPTSSSIHAYTHGPKSAYPHAMHAGTTTPTAASHQRRHSLSRVAPHSHTHTRSHSGRLGGTTGPSSAASAAASVAPPVGLSQPQSQPQTQSYPGPQPRPLSPASQLAAFRQSDASATMTPAGDEARDGEYTRMRTSDYEELRTKFDQLVSQNEELRVEREHHGRHISRVETELRNADKRGIAFAKNVGEWIKTGENLLRSFAETIAAPAFNGRGHAHVLESNHDRERARLSGGSGIALSSAMVGGADKEYGLTREKTLSVVLPGSPYTHGRPNSGYGPGHDSYPMYHSATPTHSESAMQYPRSAAGQPPRPTHNSSNSHSLRRSRRPSSDELAEIHGGKRIKANNGTFIRTSPDATERTGHSGPASASSLGHPLSRINAIAAGDYTSYPTSHHRASGSLGSALEHGRDSPLHRRLMATRDEEEDESFPSPRRSFVAPTSAQAAVGNGHASTPVSARPVRVAALAGDEADAVGSPDVDTTVHESLMEMIDEEDPEGPRPARGLRHVRGSVMRNGSRSSINSQDIDDMLAEVVDDDSSRRGGIRPKPRYRGPNSSTTPQAGSAVSTFPIHLGTHSEALSPGQTRSYTPSKGNPAPSVSPAPQLPNSSSRGFVFRNTDVADMEAQQQARSPEDLGHRPSLSGSGSFTGAQPSPPGTSGNHITTQFLPPQSGPPQPKKIYHSKGTGQVIGGQHAAMINPAPSAPVEATPQPSRPIAPTSSFTVDGLPKRTCKQCGQPGRYKDNKCVEKWGPGPQGPGTVCDRCRKKMKRVEKRATQDSAAMNAALNHHQYPIAPAPSGSFSNQGSQRMEESQEYGYSQGAEDTQTQPPLSRSASQNHSAMHVNRRESRAPDMHRDATLPYPTPANPARESMPPPTSFSGAYGSPRSSRSKPRDRSVDTRDGDLDADGDAEMDELVDDEFGAAADAAAAAASRRRDPVKPEP